jgi:two-component system, OmpR family, response regulator ChvI
MLRAPNGAISGGFVSATIALVDDDRNILTSVAMTLQAEGFATRVYADGEAALKALTDNPADLVVSDIKMPRMNGLELLEKLRAQSDMPVIMLTSKDDEADEALGLELGADDYITKPFSPTLLVARIRAILRRATIAARAAEESPDQEVVRGELALDAERHRVIWKGNDVKLTVTEFLILEALAQRPGVVKTRNQLLDAAYGDDGFVDDRTIDSHIKRIRRKFRQADGEFDGIKTLYGAGYRFAAD